MGLRRFERRLEHLVEGTFARVFKSGLNPLEIGQRIIREIDANQSVSVDGSVVVPNHYWVFVSTPDHSRFFDVETPLTNELIEAARAHIHDEGYRVFGPVSVSFVETAKYSEGTFQVQAQWREGPASHGQAKLLLETGQQIALARSPLSIGRVPGNSLVLADQNVSRNHAVIRPAPGGWLIVDLNSMNGTTVNGARVTETLLHSGDRVVFGSTEATFQVG